MIYDKYIQNKIIVWCGENEKKMYFVYELNLCYIYYLYVQCRLDVCNLHVCGLRYSSVAWSH